MKAFLFSFFLFSFHSLFSKGGGAYLEKVFTKHIPKHSIKVLLEIGSRDCLDAISLSKYYNTKVYAFECNPEALVLCEKNIAHYSNVILVPYACWDKTDIITFFPVVGIRNNSNARGYNLGASSCFKVQPGGPEWVSKQSEINVRAIRLDEWMVANNIDHIDLLCMDTQGATLSILKGLGEKLQHVKYIITEADVTRYYIGEPLYNEIADFLSKNGFKVVSSMGDALRDVLFERID